MELGAKLHRMNDDRLFVRIVVEYDHLEQPARAIRADDEIAALSCDHPQGIANRVVDVLIADPVLARAIRNLHVDKVTLSNIGVKVTLCAVDDGKITRDVRLP